MVGHTVSRTTPRIAPPAHAPEHLFCWGVGWSGWGGSPTGEGAREAAQNPLQALEARCKRLNRFYR
eukprot:4336206-Alexandrium_andersonii.AAC.1